MYIVIGKLRLDDAWDLKLSKGIHNYHCRTWAEVSAKIEDIQAMSIVGTSVDKYEVYSVRDHGYLLTFPNT